VDCAHIGVSNFDHAAVWCLIPGDVGIRSGDSRVHSNKRCAARGGKYEFRRLHESAIVQERFAEGLLAALREQPRPVGIEEAVDRFTRATWKAIAYAGIPWVARSGYNSADGLPNRQLTQRDLNVILQKHRHLRKYKDAVRAKQWDKARQQWSMYSSAAIHVGRIVRKFKAERDAERMAAMRDNAGGADMWKAMRDSGSGNATSEPVRLRVPARNGAGEETTQSPAGAAEEFTFQWEQVLSRGGNIGPEADRWRAELDDIMSHVAAQMRGEIPSDGGPFDRDFTMDELDAVIAKMRSHGAADEDGLSYDPFKFMPVEAKMEILYIANLSVGTGAVAKRWREAFSHMLHKPGRDPADWGSYRAICITSILLKLIEAMIDKRISTFHAAVRFISLNQFGFQEGVSIFDCLYAAAAASGEGDVRGPRSDSPGDRFSFYLDLLQAFPRAFMPTVLVELYKSGVKGRTWWWMCTLYMEQYNTITVDGVRGRRYRQHGLREGSPCSPRLFMIMINRVFEIMHGLGIKVGQHEELWLGLLGFADDLSGHADSDDDLQEMLDRLDIFARDYLLQFTGSKCSVTVSLATNAPGRTPKQWPFRCADGVTAIGEANTAKQLGIRKNDKRNAASHAASRCSVAHAVSARMATAGVGAFGVGGRAEEALTQSLWDSAIYFGTEMYPGEIAKGKGGHYQKIALAASAAAQAMHGGARGPDVAAEFVTGIKNPFHVMETRAANEIGRRLARPPHTLTHKLQREEREGRLFGVNHRAATAAIADRAGLGEHYAAGTCPGGKVARHGIISKALVPLHRAEQEARAAQMPSMAFANAVRAHAESVEAPMPENRNYNGPGYPVWRAFMAGGDRLNEYPRSASRAIEHRACEYAGCGGTVETKCHHIGQCRKPSMLQIRARFAAKYGIQTTGGTFLDSQVVEIMAYDSSGWGAALDAEQTEAAVQGYLGELHLDRFGGRSG